MKKLILVMALFAMMTGLLVAQDTNADTQVITVTINEIALLAVTPADASAPSVSAAAPSVTITVTQPELAGDAPVVAVNHDPTYLRYTSLRFGGLTRKITVDVSAEIPGMLLKVSATENPTRSIGKVGTGLSDRPLTTTAANLIEDIGPGLARTGIDTNDGHQLTYAAEIDVDNLNQLGTSLTDILGQVDFEDTVITVTFTLVDL